MASLPDSPTLLAIELSGSASTVALLHDGTVHQQDFTAARGKALMPAIQDLLHDNATKEDLQGILVGTGPGSYTGLRIACAAGITLGYALEIPVLGHGSFETFAFSYLKENEISKELHLFLDAFRKETYHASFRLQQGKLQRVTAPEVLPQEESICSLSTSALYLEDPTVFQPEAKHQFSYHLAHFFGQDLWDTAKKFPPAPLYLRPPAYT